MSEKEKPFYVLRRHTKGFNIDDFAFERYMSVDDGRFKNLATFKKTCQEIS